MVMRIVGYILVAVLYVVSHLFEVKPKEPIQLR